MIISNHVLCCVGIAFRDLPVCSMHSFRMLSLLVVSIGENVYTFDMVLYELLRWILVENQRIIVCRVSLLCIWDGSIRIPQLGICMWSVLTDIFMFLHITCCIRMQVFLSYSIG